MLGLLPAGYQLPCEKNQETIQRFRLLCYQLYVVKREKEEEEETFHRAFQKPSFGIWKSGTLPTVG